MIDTIAKMLKDITGVDTQTRGPSMLNRAVNQRVKDLRLKDIEHYFQVISDKPEELQMLIDELMVTETWFYRDHGPFEYLSKFLEQEWPEKRISKDKLNILSLPCATGEEPYSIAMVLLENGVNKNEFSIDAVDISQRAIRTAKRGVYGKHSFRNSKSAWDDQLKDEYFIKKKNGYSIVHDVKESIEFHHLNFWQDNFPEEGIRYDVVFCRNLLIYFDQVTQQKAIRKLHEIINPDGLLFVGHAESLCVTGSLFAPVREDRAFAFRKSASRSRAIVVERMPYIEKEIEVNSHSQTMVDELRDQSELQRFKDEVKDRYEQSSRFELEDAQIQFDEGWYVEAASICRRHLKRHPNSAHAYYLLARCYEAEKMQAAAVRLHKKAITIEPDHYQALTNLARLMKAEGDLVSATIYETRANRILSGNQQSTEI